MDMREQENRLFARWAQKYEGLFVVDGVPSPQQFADEKTRITFVLKEANSLGESWDMRSWISEYGGLPKTWNNIARWTQAILAGGAFTQAITDDDRISWLKRISFLNLKKVGGANSSSPEEIRQYAKNDAELILEQLSIYKPDIIICCGLNLVADCLADYVFKYEGKWEHCPEIYDACCWFYTEKLGKNTAVLNCYHPLNLGTGLTNIELFEAIKRILPILKQNALI